ncbi:MAG: DNA/RNA non-specific endonuclease [Bacteroidales bacterium]|nr:DNA/RNA non-specific endonuclease [Bacteroidales bacterium]
MNQPHRYPATGNRQKSRQTYFNILTQHVGIVAAIVVIVLAALIISSVATKSENTGGRTALPPSTDLETVVTNANVPEYLIRYQGFTVSFNPDTHQPNWVAWELLGSETDGENAREQSGGFATDPNVPGCARSADYTRSGYDRGHMAPAGDMKWSESTMNQSFLMTNICPQAGELNRGAWKKLEEKCRQKAVADSAVIIVCGPVFAPGKTPETIGDTKIKVPDSFFKVILSPYADPPTAIGFIMPNGNVPGGMQTHAVSVDDVEALTGYDFFSALPDNIETELEASCDFNRWSRIRHGKH